MSLDPRRFLRSLWRASRALIAAFAGEHNFRLQVVGGVVILLVAVLLGSRGYELALLVAVLGAVPTLELVNSSVEHLVDLMQPRVHQVAAVVKNMMAGAVLLAALTAVITVAIILLPRLVPG